MSLATSAGRGSVVLLCVCLVGGLATAADGSETEPAIVQDYQWAGATPVDVFVCNPIAGCPGHIVEETDWIDDLPAERTLVAVDVALEWEPVDDTVGPMVLRLNRMSADGTLIENLVHLEAEASPIALSWAGTEFSPGEFGRLTVWPAEKAAVGPVTVYVDLAEQPFEVSGVLAFASTGGA